MRILIIEDNAGEMELLKEILDDVQAEIETATTAKEGRERIEKNPPDLLVLDLLLPDAFGLDICKDMKKSHPEIKVFVLTALGASKDVVSGLESGADDYLGKPFDEKEFLARVRLLMRKNGKK